MKTTIDMTREAGLLTWLKPPDDVIERFKAFEALVRADQREIDAKVCENWTQTPETTGMELALCAAAIRARGLK
jgi:hypothetical protein